MELVNEENNFPFRPLHFFHHILHPLFKLAAIFRAGNHESEVERQKLFALQHFGNIACRHARGESFGNRRLPHARLADEHRIVLGATRENLNNSVNFYIAADNRVKLVLGGEFGEITRVLGERAETLWLRGLPVFRGLKLFQDGDRGVAAYSEACENVCGRARMFNDGEEEMLGADEGIVHPRRNLPRRFKRLREIRREIDLICGREHRGALGRLQVLKHGVGEHNSIDLHAVKH